MDTQIHDLTWSWVMHHILHTCLQTVYQPSAPAFIVIKFSPCGLLLSNCFCTLVCRWWRQLKEEKEDGDLWLGLNENQGWHCLGVTCGQWFRLLLSALLSTSSWASKHSYCCLLGAFGWFRPPWHYDDMMILFHDFFEQNKCLGFTYAF